MGEGVWESVCVVGVYLRNMKVEMTDHRQGSKLHIRNVFVTQVTLMKMNAISGSPQQNYLMWQGKSNPTS